MTRPRLGAALMLLGLLAFATPASAQRVWEVSASSWAGVWRSSSLVQEGQDLENLGQYDLAAQRMVCLVDKGTRVAASFSGGVQLGDGDYLGGVARIVVIEGPAKGCTGYLSSMKVRLVREASKPESAPSPCWMTKTEMAPIKAAVDAGNLTGASELNQKAADRMTECKKSPCFMTKEESASIRAASNARNNKLTKELLDRSNDRSNKCWADTK